MVSITCDACGKLRPQDDIRAREEWLLGYDVQTESENALSHAIRFLDSWDPRRVLEIGAIQICSEKCKQAYLAGRKAA